MAVEKKSMDRGSEIAWGVIFLVLCAFIGMSMFSYDWKDISLLAAPTNATPSNLIGPVGAWLSYVLLMAFGVGAWLVPVWCAVMGAMLLLRHEGRVWPRAVWILVTTLSLVGIAALCTGLFEGACAKLNIGETGGLFGRILTDATLVRWLNHVGAGIVLGVLFVSSLAITIEMKNIARAGEYLMNAYEDFARRRKGMDVERQEKQQEMVKVETPRRRETEKPEDMMRKRQEDLKRRQEEEAQNEKKKRRLERVMQDTKTPEQAPYDEEQPVAKPERTKAPAPAVAAVAIAVDEDAPPPAVVTIEPEKKKEVPQRKPAVAKQEPEPEKERPVTAARVASNSPYELPPLSLLNETKTVVNREITTDSGTTSKILIETLQEFGIEAEITNIEKGPVVTRYELLPAPGVRVEKISALGNNIALALKATSIRVQAPIPGKGVVGIEVPNSTASMVYLREVLEGPVWQSGKAKLPLVLGKDVGGNDLVADLAAMPHLLVAGATGAGKTVCMNSILTGLLMSRTPSELKLMLVDPKIVEFSVYENIPHLVVPVITNPKKVGLGLRWAINEMEKRYKLFAKVGVRNIESYNNREIVKQPDLFETGAPAEERVKDEPPAKVPYIVIIIDELADLMLVDQAEIETSVARLAQLSRAVGIHMILSTQRPSVNVITGTIKANFPSRIAFQVAQKTDSRTILDTIGAEKLLGRGDMLFLPPGSSKMIRAQGVMTSDEEIKKVAEFVKKQGAPEFEMEIKERIEKPTSKLDEGEDDDMITQAVEIIRETQRASTSSLQRRLRIGYTRAARIMDILEERGIVGPPRGSDAREIMVDLDVEQQSAASPAPPPEGVV